MALDTPLLHRRYLAVTELKGMQHVANLTMEVSSDANVVVEEGPQTSTIFNINSPMIISES